MALFGTDPLDELLVPDGTHAKEHDLVTDGDVIVASQSAVGFGVRGENVVAGERVEFGGDIEAEGDCRLDTWCDVSGNVLVGEDAYLGERCHIGGELLVAGNLDIGDDVQIDEAFEANGQITIRNPMPTIVFLFIYLSQLLRIGEEEAADELLSAITDPGDREHEPVLVPRGSRVGDDAWRVSTPGRIGDDCRLHGNIRAESLVVGRDNELFGSLRAREGITVGSGTEVTGNVTTREGTVRIGPGTTVRGDVAGEFVEVHRQADIEGAIRANEEMSMVSEPVLDDAVFPTGDEDDENDEDHESETDSQSGKVPVETVGARTDAAENTETESTPQDDGGDRSTAGEESDDPSTGEESDDPSTDEGSDGPSTGEDSDDPSTGEGSDEPSTGEESDEPYTGEESDESSTDEESDDPSTDEESDEPSTDEESDEPSTDEESDKPSTGEESDEPSTGEESDEPSTDEESDDPSTGEEESIVDLIPSASGGESGETE